MEGMRTLPGFTLIELLVTLVVALVLLGVGIPLFQGTLSGNRAATQVNELVSAFKLARSEAVTRGSAVSVCAVADPAVEPVACGGSGDWANGWVVFVDDSGSAMVIDGSDVRVRIWGVATGASVTAGIGALQFAPGGEVSWGTADASVSFETAVSGTSQQRCVTVTTAGQMRAQKGACP